MPQMRFAEDLGRETVGGAPVVVVVHDEVLAEHVEAVGLMEGVEDAEEEGLAGGRREVPGGVEAHGGRGVFV